MSSDPIEETTLECPYYGQSFTVRERRLPPHEPPAGSNAQRFKASTRCFGSGNRLGVRVKKRPCEVCGTNKTVLEDGQLIEHMHDGTRCAGGRELPSAAGADVASVLDPPTPYRGLPVDEESGNSVRTVSGGLPTTGRRRR
jgi:hypothetical protein